MCSTPQSQESSASERGSAVAEFVFTSTLLVLVCAAVFQLAFALHARNTIIDSAGEGARHAALRGSSLSAGVAHTKMLISQSLPQSYATQVTAVVTHVEGMAVVEVNVASPLPLLGFLGPQVIHSTGHAALE